MGRQFPVWEKSGNFEQTGKVKENDTKYLKSQVFSDKCYFNDILMSSVFFAINVSSSQLKKNNKTLIKYWKNGKIYWKSQEILSVRKSGKSWSFHLNLFNLNFTVQLPPPPPPPDIFTLVHYLDRTVGKRVIGFGLKLKCLDPKVISNQKH